MDIDERVRLQFDAVTRRQAIAAGLSPKAIRWRVSSGRWQTLHPGVYAVHNGPVSWPTRAWGALLHAGAGAVLGLEAAAYAHGFGRGRPVHLTVVVPRERRVRPADGVSILRRDVERDLAAGLPVTTVEETVLALADRGGLDDAVGWAARAVQRRLASAASLGQALATRPRHRHRKALALALGMVGEGQESTLEVRYCRDVERRHGLPRAQVQVPASVDGQGIRRDFEYREFATVCEVDGRLGHVGEGMWTDRRRDRAAAGRGLLTIRAGWVDVAHHPCQLALDVARTLRSRGWRGEPRTCRAGCPVGAAR